MLLRSPPPDPYRLLAPGRVDGGAGGDARWWVPSLVQLTELRTDLSVAALDAMVEWMEYRHDCFYTVVQEETDDHLSLTASAWPLVDDRGRLRFSTIDDPVELHVERHELQSLVDAHRAHWHELDLVGAEQARAPIKLGDTFAIRFARPSGTIVRLREAPLSRSTTPAELLLVPEAGPATGSERPSGPAAARVPAMRLLEMTWSRTTGRTRRRRVASTTDVVLDITWDARQAGKVAQLAAFAGVLDADPAAALASRRSEPTRADAELIAEGLDRQLRAYSAGLGPDETLTIDDDSADPAGRT